MTLGSAIATRTRIPLLFLSTFECPLIINKHSFTRENSHRISVDGVPPYLIKPHKVPYLPTHFVIQRSGPNFTRLPINGRPPVS
jgi:hypothetical protein